MNKQKNQIDYYESLIRDAKKMYSDASDELYEYNKPIMEQKVCKMCMSDNERIIESSKNSKKGVKSVMNRYLIEVTSLNVIMMSIFAYAPSITLKLIVLIFSLIPSYILLYEREKLKKKN